MFVVARRLAGRLVVIADLQVVLDEVDGALQIVAYFQPTPSVTKPMELSRRSNNCYEALLNAFELRELLRFMQYSQDYINVTTTAARYDWALETLSWRTQRHGKGYDFELPTGYNIGKVDQVRAHYKHAVGENRDSGVLDLSLSQIYEVLRSATMDVTQDEPPSWVPAWS